MSTFSRQNYKFMTNRKVTLRLKASLCTIARSMAKLKVNFRSASQGFYSCLGRIVMKTDNTLKKVRLKCSKFALIWEMWSQRKRKLLLTRVANVSLIVKA